MEYMKSRMIDRQPAIVKAQVTQQYLQASLAPAGYQFLGRDSGRYNYRSYDAPIIDNDGQTRILDVGAGAGRYMQYLTSLGHDAIGVSAYDYSNGTNPTLKLGDIHSLQSIEGVRGHYQYVMSRWTLRHLADPLACFEQMLDSTAVGGETLIDDFHLPEKSDSTLLLDYLCDSGAFELVRYTDRFVQTVRESTQAKGLIPRMAIQRINDTPIRLPLTYSVLDEGSWCYVEGR